MREAISARIDALPADARSVLLAAAVVGRTFWRGVVAAVEDVDDIDDTLALLELRDLVRRDSDSQLAGDVQLTFKHVLVHEAAYATVPRPAASVTPRWRPPSRSESAGRQHSRPCSRGTGARPVSRPAQSRTCSTPRTPPAGAGRRTRSSICIRWRSSSRTPDERRRLRLRRGLALVDLADYEQAVVELEELLPMLEGPERFDALVGLGHAYVWTERDVDTLANARAAAELADELDDPIARVAALATESHGLAMRGDDGDLARAFELGEEACAGWTAGVRPTDYTEHLHLHADTAYWVGAYPRALELSRLTRARAEDIFRAESLLRGGGHEALTLAALGRHEEAIAIWDELFELAREFGRSRQVLLNYSSLAYRELYDLREARARSEEALELSQADSFSMPRQFAGSDLLFTDLLAGDVGAAQAVWQTRWDGIEEATAWTTWLIRGRLAVARAEIALAAETPESALEWAERSLSLARRTARRKYEARSLTLVGQSLVVLKRNSEAVAVLRDATVVADALIGPPARWQAWGALGEGAYACGDDDTAAEAFGEAWSLLSSFAATLRPERAATLLAAPQVEAIVASVPVAQRGNTQ